MLIFPKLQTTFYLSKNQIKFFKIFKNFNKRKQLKRKKKELTNLIKIYLSKLKIT